MSSSRSSKIRISMNRMFASLLERLDISERVLSGIAAQKKLLGFRRSSIWFGRASTLAASSSDDHGAAALPVLI